MTTQFATGIESGDDGHETGHRAARDAASSLAAVPVDFCQVFCSPRYDYAAVLDGIREVIGPDAELIGCSSAGEFTEAGVAEGAVCVALVASDAIEFQTGLGTGLADDVVGCVREAVAGFESSHSPHPHRSAIALHDGLAGVGEQLALTVQRKLGQHVTFAGGSAGDEMRMERTHVFRNGRIESDAVAIASIESERPVTITVNHGHEPISGPLTVTDATDNVVEELDGRPAFEVWTELVRESARDRYGVDVDALEPGTPQFTKMLTRYEFGIDQGNSFKIRWPGPTASDDGPMEFAVDVPEGTVLRVMHSPEDEQVRSVREAAREARREMGDVDPAGAFVYDCVCRAVILEDAFPRAVEGLAAELDVPLAGFETYGELCMQTGQTSGYHNTTSVVVLLPR